ncbi:MAG: purine-nucleoside phosphorylase [Halanaerobiaceae bacterium]
MISWKEKRKKAGKFIHDKCNTIPEIGLILGSGLGEYSELLENKTVISYDKIPHFPCSTIEGHNGELVLGERYGKKIMAMNGRVHFYEGYSMKEVVFPIRVMKELGIDKLIITNAAGGLNPSFRPGDLMVITDHLNFMGSNPLIGENDEEIGPRFPAMTQAHPREYIKLAENAAASVGIHIMKGVYLAISGPVYETTAMSKFQRLIGADAVGMSTVPELIAATHAEIDNLAISCITDIVKDNPEEALTHEEVMEVARKTKPLFKNLMDEIVKKI